MESLPKSTSSANKKSEINIVLWAYEISRASDIALKFLNNTNTIKSKPNLFSLEEKSHKINIYLRSPKAISTSAPEGITSILILYLSSEALKLEMLKDPNNQELLEAKNYLDSRKKIPFKFITTENFCVENPKANANSEEEILSALFPECKKMLLSELLCDNGKTSLLSDTDFFESFLQNVFKKFDLDNDNLISFEDLIKAAAELGHILSSDDAKMIVNSLDRDNPGKIGFEAFKRWWVLGRSDFLGFRRACKARLFLDDLLQKAQNGLNTYFVNLRNEAKEICNEELTQDFDLSLHGEKPFEDGIGLFMQFCNGAEALEIIETKFDEQENSELGVALKFKFDSAESAKNEIEKVENFVNEILSLLLGDRASLVFLLGLVLRFKVCENFVVVFFADKRPKADSMLTGFKAFFTGTVHLFTELAFEDLLTLPLEKVIEKLLNMKLRVNAKMFDLKQMLGKLLKQIEIVKKRELEEKATNENNENNNIINAGTNTNINVNKELKYNNTPENIINIHNIPKDIKDNNAMKDKNNLNNKNNNDNDLNEVIENKYLKDFKNKYKKILNIIKFYLMLRSFKLELSYDSGTVKDQLFEFLGEIKNKIEKEKGEDSFEIKYEHLNEQDMLFESPANFENLEEKISAYYNLIDFFFAELREYYQEILSDRELIKSLFDEEGICFLNKIDLNEVILECHSRSIITPLYAKFTLKIPKFKKVIDAVFKEN